MGSRAASVTMTETERIQWWRAEELERAGYSPGAAFELACCPHVDLHRAAELLEQGCSEEVALEILL